MLEILLSHTKPSNREKTPMHLGYLKSCTTTLVVPPTNRKHLNIPLKLMHILIEFVADFSYDTLIPFQIFFVRVLINASSFPPVFFNQILRRCRQRRLREKTAASTTTERDVTRCIPTADWRRRDAAGAGRRAHPRASAAAPGRTWRQLHFDSYIFVRTPPKPNAKLCRA